METRAGVRYADILYYMPRPPISITLHVYIFLCGPPYLSIIAIFQDSSYISCAYIILILRNPPICPIFHILPVYGLAFSIFHGAYPSAYGSRIPTIYPLYHVGIYPIPLLYPITIQKPPTFIRNWAAVRTSAESRKRQPTWGLAS